MLFRSWVVETWFPFSRGKVAARKRLGSRAIDVNRRSLDECKRRGSTLSTRSLFFPDRLLAASLRPLWLAPFALPRYKAFPPGSSSLILTLVLTFVVLSRHESTE